MAASTSTEVPSTQNEDISLLRAVLGRTSREVKDYTVQYEDQAKVVEALGAAAGTPEYAAAIDVLAMRERRLDSALGREANALQKLTDFCVADKSAIQAQSAAAAAALSPPPGTGGATTSTTVPSSSTGALSKKLMKRKLPEPDDGWKDHTGKTHKKHHDQMVYHKTVSGIFWQVMEIVHETTSKGSGEPLPDVLMAKLVPFKEMEAKWDTYSLKELLDMGLNTTHEAAHSLYVKHVYNGAVAETFLGDALFGADRTIPVEERVDSAVKRVQKLTTAAKAAVGQTSSRGGSSSGRRGGGRRGGSSNYNGGRGQQQYNRDYSSDYRPSGPPSFGRFGPGSFGGNNFGGGRGNGERTCFICGSTGHQAKQCPKAG
jgi:hypothetical protein